MILILILKSVLVPNLQKKSAKLIFDSISIVAKHTHNLYETFFRPWITNVLRVSFSLLDTLLYNKVRVLSLRFIYNIIYSIIERFIDQMLIISKHKIVYLHGNQVWYVRIIQMHIT